MFTNCFQLFDNLELLSKIDLKNLPIQRFEKMGDTIYPVTYFSNGVVLGPLSFDGPSFGPSFAPVGVPSSMPSHDEGKTVFIILVFLILIAFLGSLYIKHKQQHINIEIESI